MHTGPRVFVAIMPINDQDTWLSFRGFCDFYEVQPPLTCRPSSPTHQHVRQSYAAFRQCAHSDLIDRNDTIDAIAAEMLLYQSRDCTDRSDRITMIVVIVSLQLRHKE